MTGTSTDVVLPALIEALKQMNYPLDGEPGQTPLGEDGLDLESLAVAELALWVEDTFRVKFGDDEMEGFAALTVAGLAAEIAARMEPALTVAGLAAEIAARVEPALAAGQVA